MENRHQSALLRQRLVEARHHWQSCLVVNLDPAFADCGIDRSFISLNEHNDLVINKESTHDVPGIRSVQAASDSGPGSPPYASTYSNSLVSYRSGGAHDGLEAISGGLLWRHMIEITAMQIRLLKERIPITYIKRLRRSLWGPLSSLPFFSFQVMFSSNASLSSCSSSFSVSDVRQGEARLASLLECLFILVVLTGL